jgi:hypothetical protein
MPVTLVLTRNPLREFRHGHQSGRFGELIAVKGPKVTAARLASFSLSSPLGSAGSGRIPVGNGTLELSMSPGTVEEVKRFTTIERFRADSGQGFYVQLHPKPEPYGITFEAGNSAVKHLRNGHDGRCFRVHGGKAGAERGILIHEAPHVGWVIGCISPRPLNDFRVEFDNAPGNPSFQSMNELFRFVGAARADLFVLDW